jgi:hypothetical protein
MKDKKNKNNFIYILPFLGAEAAEGKTPVRFHVF